MNFKGFILNTRDTNSTLNHLLILVEFKIIKTGLLEGFNLFCIQKKITKSKNIEIKVYFILNPIASRSSQNCG